MNSKARILIVDDQKSARETLQALLLKENYDLVFAENGSEALEKAQKQPPDLILLDVMMPDMDGFEVCQRLRSDYSLGEIPVIMVTALDDNRSRMKGIEAGADDFVTKPYDRTELRIRIRTIVRLDRYRKLLAERANYEQLVELSPEGIMIVDMHEIIRLVNSQIVRMLGISTKDDIIERRISTLNEFENRELLLLSHQRIINGIIGNPLFEVSIIRVGGDNIPVEVCCGPFTYMGKPAAQFVMRDITERKRAEEVEREAETLKRVDRFRKELLSDISHELRTPLAGIKGYTTLLLSYGDKLANEKKSESLISIDYCTNRLLELVDNLLDISRFESGTMNLDRKQYDIKYVLHEAVKEAKTACTSHTIQLAKVESGTVSIDMKRIQQVIGNLIGNAIKYSAEGTEIFITGEKIGAEFIVSVSDEGMGIPEDKLDKVFDKLYRIDQKQTGAPGLGLGLAICKQIIGAHGGQIWARSKVGEGSTFYFTIPLESSGKED